MGSFQQISIGISCLAAAFVFGNYVNNHQTASHPLEDATTTELAKDGSSKLNSVESKIADRDLEIVQKGPAQMRVMQTPLKQRSQMPFARTPLSADDASSMKANRLPPPSELAARNRGNSPTGPMLSPNLNDQLESPIHGVKFNDIPDFSTIAADIENTRIKMADTNDPTARQIPATRKPGSNPDAIMPNPDRNIAVTTPALVRRPNFNDDDFNHRLKDQFSNSSGNRSMVETPPRQSELANLPVPNPQSQSLAESMGFSYAAPPDPDAATPESTDEIDPWNTNSAREQASSLRFPPHSLKAIPTQPESKQLSQPSSNRVVSREPLPPLNPNRGDVGRGDQIANSQPANRIALAKIGETAASAPATNIQSEAERQDSGLTHSVWNSIPATENSELGQDNSRARTRLPFALNDQGRRQLVAIRARTTRQLESKTTQFVEHVIEPDETLQSISTRYFGKPDHYLDIYLANQKQLKTPIDTPDGVAIRIPIY
ncbi:MAG: hypothetical protein ACI87E_002601 [Mariniblastus sp.]|jgi:hypothetical protein